MTPKETAKMTGIPHDAILSALRGGSISGKKYRGRWHIKPRDAWRLKTVNDAKLDSIREEYISLYREGLTVDRLQARVKNDFLERNIVWPATWFAERTIYQSVMKR